MPGPAKVGYSQMTLRSFVLFIAFVLAFGHGFMEVPFDVVTRQGICRREFSTREDLRTCLAAPEVAAHQKFKANTQLFMGLYGFVFSYPLGKLTDRVTRSAAATIGILLWLSGQSIGGATMGIDPRAYYGLSFLTVTGRLLTETALFATITDLSTNLNRCHNHVLLVFLAFTGYVFGQLLSGFSTFLKPSGLVLIGSICIGLCLFPVIARQDTQKSKPNGPRQLWERALLNAPTICLLFIAAALPALGPVVIAWLEKHLPAAYDISPIVLGMPLRFMFFAAILFGMVMTLFATGRLSPDDDLKNLTEDRCKPDDVSWFATTFLYLQIGCILFVVQGKGAALAGVVLSGLGSGVAALPTALILCLVGPDIRSKYTGRVFGMLNMVRSQAVAWTGKFALGFAARQEPSEVGVLWMHLVAVGFLTILLVPVCKLGGKLPPLPPANADGIELQDMGGQNQAGNVDEEAAVPAAPPPAYAAR
ncbi:major facilitator superfamily transporter [Colletotrichum musicola]|uniref:Major facilitator superfamily transporter n=1 Tax=Colletotrichum musicola TaxID=2175873 RepID=A0A8H6JZW8_9PEZI|nr:major facilitator superfamily transporter [Colletotrichum musicola]